MAQRTLCTQAPFLPLSPQERRQPFEVEMIDAATACPERSCTKEFLTLSEDGGVEMQIFLRLSSPSMLGDAAAELGVLLHYF